MHKKGHFASIVLYYFVTSHNLKSIFRISDTVSKWYCYVLTTNQSWTLSYWCCYNDVDRCRCMFFRICLCSRFCLILAVLILRKPNSSTIRAFGRMMLVAVHVSRGVFWEFLFRRLGWYPAQCLEIKATNFVPAWYVAWYGSWRAFVVDGESRCGQLGCKHFLGILHVVCIQQQKKGTSCTLNWSGYSNR